MRAIRILTLGLVAAAVITGCNTLAGQPELRNALIQPEDLNPGDTAIITVEAVDRHRVINRIEGVVKEDERITFKLRDDGQAPDQVAGDGVWTLQVDVPFQAPPGDFLLVLSAFRDDGLPVEVRDDGGNVLPLQAQLPVVIRYADQPAPESDASAPEAGASAP